MRIETRKVVRLSFALFVTLSIAVMAGCDPKPASNANSNPANSNPAGAPSSKAAKSGATGTLTVDPNPVKVCDGSALGVANVSWTFSGTQRVEVHIGAPNGVVFAMAEAPGTQRTGKWVGNGTVFYLQDAANGLPATADYTIASATANTTTQGCP